MFGLLGLYFVTMTLVVFDLFLVCFASRSFLCELLNPIIMVFSCFLGYSLGVYSINLSAFSSKSLFKVQILLRLKYCP